MRGTSPFTFHCPQCVAVRQVGVTALAFTADTNVLLRCPCCLTSWRVAVSDQEMDELMLSDRVVIAMASRRLATVVPADIVGAL